MKSTLKPLAACLVSAMLLTVAVPTYASEHGCTVLLCLAGNWKSIGECQGPVKKLFKDLAKGRAFPTCDMSDGNNDGNNYATKGSDPIEDCPVGMVATPGLKQGYGGPYKECTSEKPVCTTQQTYMGPKEVCEFQRYEQKTWRKEPNWIDVYVDGKKTNRVWWGY